MKYYLQVVKRELRQMFSRPLYIFGSFGVMAFVCIFFLTIMGEGLPERLPVGIVDHDHSSISRMIKRELGAGQAVEIYAEYASYEEARQAMQRGDIYAFMVLPSGLYQDILAFHRPTVTLYANSAYTLSGALSYKQLMTMANLASGAVQREVMRGRGYTDEQIMPLVQPVVVDTHILANPWINYSIYLSSVLLPGILGMMVLLLSAFSMLYEIKKRTSPQWLEAAGGSVVTAVFGKMLPYTVLFTVIGWAINVLLYKVMHFPMNGSFWFQCVATGAFVLAMQAVAAFVVSCVPSPKTALSLCSFYSTLTLTLAGFSYPVEAMLSPFQAFSYLIPLRYYYLITVEQMLMGLPVVKSCIWLACLMAAALVPIPFAGRLKNALQEPENVYD